MHPLLVKIGPIPIHSYGFLIAVGFLTALYVLKRLSIREKINVERMLDFAFWALVVGFVGARLLFILTRLDTFIADPAAIFRVWEGGLVFFGGLLSVIPFSIWYMHRFKIPLWKALDACVPGVAIAHMFGRFGCLSAGCCYGKPTGSSYGIRLYSELVDKEFRGIPLHPTQLYEATSLLILFLGLLWVSRHKRFDGQVALTYFMAYPIIRSIVEVFRGDLIRGFIIDGWFSTSQFISALVFLAAALTLVLRLRKEHARETRHG